MNVAHKFVFITSLVLGWSGVARAHALGQGEQFIAKKYSELSAATMKRDIPLVKKVWKSMAHPDFQTYSRDSKGVQTALNGDQYLQMISREVSGVTQYKRSEYEIERVSRRGKTIVAIVAFHYSHLVMNGTKAKPRPLMTEGTSIREDTWVSSGSGAAATYKLKSIKLLFDKSLLNGKPVKKLFH